MKRAAGTEEEMGGRRCGVPATSTWTCGGAGRHREARASPELKKAKGDFLFLYFFIRWGIEEDHCVVKK
jgi:hypothetical protein